MEVIIALISFVVGFMMWRILSHNIDELCTHLSKK